MEDSVSAFIIGTCRVLPKSSTTAFQANDCIIKGNDMLQIIACGSRAEFFIQPLHSCIGDIDFLMWKSQELAFTDEIPVMPYDVHHITDVIDCFMFEPYKDFPAFVRLRRLGQMRYNWESKVFEFERADDQNFQQDIIAEFMEDSETLDEETFIAGPAIRNIVDRDLSMIVDLVRSIWCPQWPKEARNWPFRRRIYGWPTAATICEVVQNGCHVVYAKHPACRDDVHQCRLSFSVAEVILLQSWTKVQQIVYHMLRFFAKRELIQQDCPKEDEVLCIYHIKTLMLWSCEEMSPEWWNTSVIAICCNLLQKLSKWLRKRKCSNYFIPEATLLNKHLSRKIVDETVDRVNKFCNADRLSLWFVQQYMQPIFVNVSKAEHTKDVNKCVNEYLLYTCDVLEAGKHDFAEKYFSVKFDIVIDFVNTSAKTEVFRYGMLEVYNYLLITIPHCLHDCEFLPSTEIDSYFGLYESTLLTLHAAHLLVCSEVEIDGQWLVDVVKQVSIKPKFIKAKHHNFPKPCKTVLDKSYLNFLNAQGLMGCLTESYGHPEFKLVSQLSKGLLWKALECDDSTSSNIASATMVYLAALYFAESEYQTVRDLGMRVIINQTPEDENKDIETLNAGCLFYIDDIVRIIGFYLLFKHIKDNLHYDKKPFFLDLRLKPEVFAQYLILLSNERRPREFRTNYDWPTPIFPLDELLTTTTKIKFCEISKKSDIVVRMRVYERTSNDTSLLSDKLIQAFMEYALENMTSFNTAICKEFDIHSNVGDCYHAAYLYKCRQYPDVLRLCERILGQPDLPSNLKKLTFANVMLLPPLHSLFDIDVQCLLGFHILVYYLSPLNVEPREIGDETELTFQEFFAEDIYSEKRSLSAILWKDYTIKCQYFIGRHFLARYLKLRCLLDCGQSHSEAIFELMNLKSSLPFEHIIRRFLKQKLQHHQTVKYVTG